MLDIGSRYCSEPTRAYKGKHGYRIRALHKIRNTQSKFFTTQLKHMHLYDSYLIASDVRNVKVEQFEY